MPSMLEGCGTGIEARRYLNMDDHNKTTILTLQKHKRTGQKTVLTTAYNYPEALLADRAGIDVIVVGDSIGMTTFGYKTTIPVTMEDMLPHCTAVWRGG